MTAPHAGDERGFSLVEALVAVAVFSLLTVGVFTLYASSSTLYYRAQSRVDTQQNARTAIEAAAREIRMAGYDRSGVLAGLSPTAPIRTANAGSITFVADLTDDGTLDQVTYTLSGTTFVRSASSWNGTSFPAATSGDVADGVSSLTFSYFDGSDASLAAPVASADLNSIERVTISLLTTQTITGQLQTFPLVVDVKLRN